MSDGFWIFLGLIVVALTLERGGYRLMRGLQELAIAILEWKQ